MSATMITSSSPVIHPDVITSIDMSSLSQSELHSLSLLSNTTNIPPFSLNNSSFFNDTSKTYPDSIHTPRRRYRRSGFSFLRRERSESSLIVDFLKGYLELGDSGRRKRKRTRVTEKEVNASVEIVNRNARENDDGPFDEELRRKSAGMEREEELLAMLADMEGEWCSRRKKRRIIPACFLGDALPVGWKVIVALRRKAGRYFPFCRRYISPTGEHLASFREVSSYLKSYFGLNETSVLRDSKGEERRHQDIVDLNQDFPYSTTVSNACVPVEPDENGVPVSSTGDLPDVQVCDLYECRPCNVRFDEKDKYLQHLMSLHQKTTKKYRLGASVGAGVIIRDGKFECQFCHKVFEERRRYFGHVGNHVRGSTKKCELSADNASLVCEDQLPTNNGISKMAALIEVAQNSAQDMSPSTVSNVDEVSFIEDSRVTGLDFKTEERLTFNSTMTPASKNGLHAESTNGNCELEYIVAQNNESSNEPKETLGIHYPDGAGDTTDSNCMARCEMEHAREYVSEDLASVSCESRASDYAMPQTSAFDEILEKEGHDMCGLDQNLKSMMRPEYMKLDEVETQMYDSMTREDLVSLSAMPMSFENDNSNNTVMEIEHDPPVGLHSLPEFCIEMAPKSVTATLCVWCGEEFCHEVVDIEEQTDSVGFMCPSCRNKISKQFNELEGNFFFNSQYC